jgi:hypothetical protein
VGIQQNQEANFGQDGWSGSKLMCLMFWAYTSMKVSFTSSSLKLPDLGLDVLEF